MDFLGQTRVSGNVTDEADRMIASDLPAAWLFMAGCRAHRGSLVVVNTNCTQGILRLVVTGNVTCGLPTA